MRRMLLAAFAAFGLGATAQAQWNMAPTPAPQAPATNMYGWNKSWAWWKKDCGPTCGSKCGSGLFGAGCGAPHPAPQSGTLVFPMNPYVRSPRDYFMWEPGK